MVLLQERERGVVVYVSVSARVHTHFLDDFGFVRSTIPLTAVGPIR